MPGPYKAANKTERQYDHAVYRTYERFTRIIRATQAMALLI